MKRQLALALLALATTAGTSDANAIETADGWTVTDVNNEGCGAYLEYEGEGETALLLGMDIEDRVRLAVSNHNWSVEEGQTYADIAYHLNGVSFGGGTVVGYEANSRKGFVVGLPGSFLDDFSRANSIQIYKGETVVDRLNLKGSGVAVVELRRCIARLKAEARKKALTADIPKDPFAADKAK